VTTPGSSTPTNVITSMKEVNFTVETNNSTTSKKENEELVNVVDDPSNIGNCKTGGHEDGISTIPNKNSNNCLLSSKSGRPAKTATNKKGLKMNRTNLIMNGETRNILNYYTVDLKKTGLLGTGAFSNVVKAVEKSTGVVRALKVIAKKVLQENPRMAQKLKDELDIMKTLDHPNIVRLHATFEDGKYIYLVLELCTGGELFDRLIKSRYKDERAAAKLMRQILSSVYYLHNNGVVHRDLKPENFIFVDDKEDSPVKLIDFGLSTKPGYCVDAANVPTLLEQPLIGGIAQNVMQEKLSGIVQSIPLEELENVMKEKLKQQKLAETNVQSDEPIVNSEDGTAVDSEEVLNFDEEFDEEYLQQYISDVTEKHGRLRRMKTKAGTPYYLAPQVLKGLYNETCDVWSCGIILFVVLCGYPPFTGSSDQEIFKKILRGKVDFPNMKDDGFEISAESKDLILQMISYNEKKRPSAKECLKHPWIGRFSAGISKSARSGLGVGATDESAESSGRSDVDVRGLQVTASRSFFRDLTNSSSQQNAANYQPRRKTANTCSSQLCSSSNIMSNSSTNLGGCGAAPHQKFIDVQIVNDDQSENGISSKSAEGRQREKMSQGPQPDESMVVIQQRFVNSMKRIS